MIDARARLVLGGMPLAENEVDFIAAIAGIFHIRPAGVANEPPAIRPCFAVVVGHEEVGVPVFAAVEVVDAALAVVLRRQPEEVRVGHPRRRASNRPLGLPGIRIAGLGRDAVADQVVASVLAVHRQVPAIAAHQQGRRVVIVLFEPGVQFDDDSLSAGQVVEAQFDVSVADIALGPSRHHAQQEPAAVDDYPLVLEPAPGPAVVKDNQVARGGRFSRRQQESQRKDYGVHHRRLGGCVGKSVYAEEWATAIRAVLAGSSVRH